MSSTRMAQWRHNKRARSPATWPTFEATENLPHTPFLIAPARSAHHPHLHWKFPADLIYPWRIPSTEVRVSLSNFVPTRIVPACVTQLHGNNPPHYISFPFFLPFPFLSLLCHPSFFLDIGPLPSHTTSFSLFLWRKILAFILVVLYPQFLLCMWHGEI